LSKIKVTQTKSVIGTTRDMRATVRSLGLHRIRDHVVTEDTPQVRGMIDKVKHLVKVERVSS